MSTEDNLEPSRRPWYRDLSACRLTNTSLMVKAVYSRKGPCYTIRKLRCSSSHPSTLVCFETCQHVHKLEGSCVEWITFGEGQVVFYTEFTTLRHCLNHSRYYSRHPHQQLCRHHVLTKLFQEVEIPPRWNQISQSKYVALDIVTAFCAHHGS
jgi:hypothetical protein